MCFTSCQPQEHLPFLQLFPFLSVTPRGDLFSISQGCSKNLPKVFCTLPLIPSLSASEPLQAWLQHTVKYSMEIPSWYICKAPLNKEQKIMRSESNLATSDTAVPDLVNSFCAEIVLVLKHLWTLLPQGSMFHTSLQCALQCRHANSLPWPWNPTCNPTCKVGTMIWPIKYKVADSNAFWQFPYSSV